MKNTILNYSLEELDDFFVRDYFSKDVKISDLFYTLGDYIDTYQMTNNDKLERISLQLYGTTDYWDILLLLNSRNPLFEMAYDYDLLVNFATNRSNYYKKTEYSHAPLNIARTAVLHSAILDAVVAENEDFRTLYIIKPPKMGTFLSLLKAQSYI